MKKPKTFNSKGSRSKAAVAPRRTKVAELLKEGKSLPEIAEETATPYGTIRRDALRLHEGAQLTQQAYHQQYREIVRKDLLMLRERAEELSGKDLIDAALSVLDRICKLDGLNAPSKSLSVSVDASGDTAKLVGYRKFVYETRFLDADSLEQVFAFARTLNVSPASRVFNPPATSELWDETPQLTEGDSE
jgi:hypothetical protein